MIPEHEMAAFFGIAETGKKVCVVSSDMIKILDKKIHSTKKKEKSFKFTN
jgi:predicted ester cyclase